MPKVDGKRAPHGTEQRYRWCKRENVRACDACRRAVARRKVEREMAKARGETFFYPTDQVIEHIEYLRSTGMGIHLICAAASMSSSTACKLRNGSKSRVGWDLQARILAVRPAPARLPPKATLLRLHALFAQGYTLAWVSQQMTEIMGHSIKHFRATNQAFVTRPLAEGMVKLCREVGYTEGPSELTRNRARGWGYRPSWDYLEDEFYDVEWDGQEEELETEDRRRALLEDAAEIEGFLREPSNQEERTRNNQLVAERLGVTWQYISKLRSREATRPASKAWKQRHRAEEKAKREEVAA